MKQINITTEEFTALMALCMCSDPSPIEDQDDAYVEFFLNNVAGAFGFDNWIQAYHQL